MKNFGRIKKAFVDIISEGVVSRGNKNSGTLKKFIKAIKESEILRTQYSVYNNIENRVDENSDSAAVYISENIKLIKKFKKADIIAENTKLYNLHKSTGKSSKDYPLSDLHETITSLIFTTVTPNNVGEYTENISKVVKHINENKDKVVNESEVVGPTSLLGSICIDKFNTEYSDLNESEREVLDVILDKSDDRKEEFHKDTIKECIELIDNQIEGVDEEIKNKMLNVKIKLLSNTFVSESFNDDIVNLLELKEDLK